MNQNIILSPIPLDDLRDDLRTTFSECLTEVLRTYQLTPPPPPDELITENEAAHLLKVSKVTMYNWRKNGKLKYHRFGTRIRYNRNELLDFANSKPKHRRGL